MNARKYTRYPVDTSVSFEIDHIIGEHQLYLQDAGQGGLCFNAHGCIRCGTHINVKIPESETAPGKIVWCHPVDNGQCRLGLKFENKIALSAIEKAVLRH